MYPCRLAKQYVDKISVERKEEKKPETQRLRTTNSVEEA